MRQIDGELRFRFQAIHMPEKSSLTRPRTERLNRRRLERLHDLIDQLWRFSPPIGKRPRPICKKEQSQASGEQIGCTEIILKNSLNREFRLDSQDAGSTVRIQESARAGKFGSKLDFADGSLNRLASPST
jgi:hypothetical protein